MASYYQLLAIKRKAQIDEAETDMDDFLQELGENADKYINLQISIHAATPISFPDEELNDLANKHAAGEYLLWNSPSHPRTLYDAARKDIQDHIQTKYGKKNPSGLTNNTFSKTSSKITGYET